MRQTGSIGKPALVCAPWEAVALADAVDQLQSKRDRLRRVGGADHDRVADALDLLGVVVRKQLPHGSAELSDDISGGLVAHGLGQRREPGQVREEEGRVLHSASSLPATHQATDRNHQLLGPRCLVLRLRADDAVVCVVVEQAEGDFVQGSLNGGDLREDVDAVAVLLDHALQTAYLAFDPA
jgi:hypothetical protein